MDHVQKHRIIVSMEKERRIGLKLQIEYILRGMTNNDLEELIAKMKEWQNLA